MTVSLTTPAHAVPESLRIAREIVDSDPVLRVFAACEWQELNDDGKLWISAIVAEARRRCIAEIRAEDAPETAQGKRCEGNLKPAPFALTPQAVARVLDATAAPSAPVSFPRPSEQSEGHNMPARVAPLQAAPSAPVEVPNPRPAGQPEMVAAFARCAVGVAAAGKQLGDAFQQAAKLARGEKNPLHAERTANPRVMAPKPERRSDVTYRRAKDRDACALEAPVDTNLAAGRLALIRETAAKLAAREKIALPAAGDRCVRLPLGAPAPHNRALPPLPSDLRRAALQAATAYLKARCILVTATDRDAQIKRYRVSGKRDSMLAHDVIAFAETLGFEVPA